MSGSTVIPRLASGKLALMQPIDAALPADAATLDLSADHGDAHFRC
ncbi:hypothetical protein [uncultured Thiodictyon sp.]|nr:hypothetical protein [uncultured Thiodictyon sp.]